MPTTITFAPSTSPRVDQMPLAALFSALLFALADLLVRWRLASPSSAVRSFFAMARGEEGRGNNGDDSSEEEEEEEEKVVAVDKKRERHRLRRSAASLDAVVEDAGIKLVGMIHVALCLPLAAFVLSEDSFKGSFSPPSSSGDNDNNGNGSGSNDPRLLLYASTPASRAIVSLSAGYFLWDVASILVRTYVASTERGRREGRSVGPGFLAHGLVCCSLFGLGALSGRLSYFAAVFLLWEASTPFVYARWALSAAKKRDKKRRKETGESSRSDGDDDGDGKSKAYTLCGLAMMASFFLARIVSGTRASLRWWVAAGAELRSPLALGGDANEKNIPAPALVLCLAANVAMNSLNFFWFSKMLAGAAKHFGGGARRGAATAESAVVAAAAAAARAASKQQEREEDAAAAAFGKTTDLAEKLQQRQQNHHHRVFSVRSTSASEDNNDGGNSGNSGGGGNFVSVRGPATPARTRED